MLGPAPKIDTQCRVKRDGHKLATGCSTNHCLDDIKRCDFHAHVLHNILFYN